MSSLRLIGAAVAVLTAASATAQDAPPTVEPQPQETMTLRRPVALEIASAYGFDQWDQVERLEFTFNVERGETKVHRPWTWWPKQGRAELRQAGREPVSLPLVEDGIMLRLGVNVGGEAVDAHRQFVNDSYWFLFPFQIVWSNPQVTDHGETPLPIGEGAGRKVTVQYPGDGGYTPGDAYDLYLGDDHRIGQWVFRRGGGDKGSPMTWETHRALGPIVVSLDHWSPDRQAHVYFTDVRVVVADADGETATHEPVPIEDD